MYVTRTLSSLLRNPQTLSEPPPPGPCSGVAVILDQDYMIHLDPSRRSNDINSLQIPHNSWTRFQKYIGGHETLDYEYNTFLVIPVVNKPLYSDTYYAVQTMRKYTGQVNSWPSEEDSEMKYLCCWCCSPYRYQNQQKPFDPNKCLQTTLVKSDQVESTFSFDFSKNDIWEFTKFCLTSWSHLMNEAESEGQGLSESLRNSLPDFGFSIGTKRSDHVVVGRWYVPFLFVHEFGLSYKEQMEISTFYKMSLEQRWERVFEADNVDGDSLAAEVDVTVKSEAVVLGLGAAVKGRGRLVDGMVIFDSDHPGHEGLSVLGGIVERMKWEQARAGWTDVEGADLRLQRVEEHAAGREWRRFGCYVLVERFVLMRLNGSLVLTYDFYHSHQLRTKWE